MITAATYAFINGIVALTVGTVALPAAIASGQQEGLCKVLKGKYDPTARDQCAGGEWARIIPYVQKP